MDCRQCAEELTAFLDAELSAADSDRVRSHLRNCTSCSEDLRRLQETADFVEAHNRELQPRPESWNLVQARITASDAARPASFWAVNRWRLALATLAIVAAFAVGYIQHQQMQRRDLDRYMSQYIEQRESQIKAQPIATELETGEQVDSPYADNPFIEIKADVPDNPFRSEDR